MTAIPARQISTPATSQWQLRIERLLTPTRPHRISTIRDSMSTSTSKSSRSLAKDFIRSEFVDWTWRRACELFDHGLPPMQNFDTPWVRRALIFLRQAATTNPRPAVDSDIAVANRHS